MKANGRTTGIEWCEHSWTPLVGCSIRSEGCRNCYAQAWAAKLAGMGNAVYRGLTEVRGGRPTWTGRVVRNSDAAVRKPLGIRRPSVFFVTSMSDFFHADAPDAVRLEAWEIMRASPRHTFQVLTKRPENIVPFFERTGAPTLPNVWLGATVEDERVVDRIAALRAAPAAVRFLSVEPLIAPLDLSGGRLDGIGWVITGGESGPGARPMHVDWLRAVRDACVAAGVPHFFKQYGTERNNPIYDEFFPGQGHSPEQRAARVRRLDPHGKGGSLLDGRYWKEMPGGIVLAGITAGGNP